MIPQLNRIYQGDALEVLRSWPDEFVQTCVTSPPYWNLRNYGVNGQLGLEKTPEEYVAKMVEVFREVRRVLRSDGTLWLNMGDGYARNPARGVKFKATDATYLDNRQADEWNRGQEVPPGLKEKDLIGMPWHIAFALQADGWYLRSDIIWAKRNCMPESVTDRPTRAHEYIFLMSKNPSYFYDADAIKEPSSLAFLNDSRHRTGSTTIHIKEGYQENGAQDPKGPHRLFDKQCGHGRRHAGFNDRWDQMEKAEQCSGYRNKRSWWPIATHPFPEAHFATFPPDIPKTCILAGTSEKGACPDCMAPWERHTDKKVFFQSGSGKSGNAIAGKNGKKLQGGGGTGDVRRGPITTTTTTEWQPTCNCFGSWRRRVVGSGITRKEIRKWIAPEDFPKPSPCIVLDPFMGAGTTALVAAQLNRRFLGIELNPDYIKIAERRIANELAQRKMF